MPKAIFYDWTQPILSKNDPYLTVKKDSTETPAKSFISFGVIFCPFANRQFGDVACTCMQSRLCGLFIYNPSFVRTFRSEALSGGIFWLLRHFCPPEAKRSLIFNPYWQSTTYKGTSFWGKQRKWHRRQQFGKNPHRKQENSTRFDGESNEEKKSTLRGVLADSTWSIGRGGLGRGRFPHGEKQNCVADFRTRILCHQGKPCAVLCA